MKLICAGLTDVGRNREHNEDDFYLSQGDEALCVVADGMGGHRSGEVASAIAIRSIVEYFRATHAEGAAVGAPADSGLSDADRDGRRLSQALLTANRAVFEAASQNENYRGMGTTVVAGLFTPNGVCLAHIGDSRCYRFRNGKLEQRTEDHSLANEYVRMGILAAEDVEFFPYKNVITRACGLAEQVEVDLAFEPLEVDDLYLFCSDGLSDMVNDRELERLLSQEDDLEALSRLLVDRANEAGGADNITLILTRVIA